eukprot:3834542-Rhodomonas_salina.1
MVLRAEDLGPLWLVPLPLCAYALATQCPVLTCSIFLISCMLLRGMPLRACYATSGTNAAYHLP